MAIVIKVAKLVIVAILLLILLGQLIAIAPSKIPWPNSCNAPKPNWFDELIIKVKEHGYPSFQVAYVDSAGKQINCVAGWDKHGLWPIPLTHQSRMRYASLSKLFTSFVVLQMFEEGSLRPSYRLLSTLDIGTPMDKRIESIEVGHLLSHKAGFDRDLSSDPMFEESPWCPGKIEFLTKLTLDHTPGDYYAYSNLGYCLLGALIEKIDDKPLVNIYEERLFSLVGISSIKPAITGVEFRDEAFKVFNGADNKDSLLVINYESLLSSGAWTGTAKDYSNLMRKLLYSDSKVQIKNDKLNKFLKVDQECDISIWRNCHGYAFYKFQQKPMRTMYWRDGSLPGVTAFYAFSETGESITLLINGRDYDWLPTNDEFGKFIYTKVINFN